MVEGRRAAGPRSVRRGGRGSNNGCSRDRHSRLRGRRRATVERGRDGTDQGRVDHRRSRSQRFDDDICIDVGRRRQSARAPDRVCQRGQPSPHARDPGASQPRDPRLARRDPRQAHGAPDDRGRAPGGPGCGRGRDPGALVQRPRTCGLDPRRLVHGHGDDQPTALVRPDRGHHYHDPRWPAPRATGWKRISRSRTQGRIPREHRILVTTPRGAVGRSSGVVGGTARWVRAFRPKSPTCEPI